MGYAGDGAEVLFHMHEILDLAPSVRGKKKVVEGQARLGTQLVSRSKLRSKEHEPAFKTTNGKQAPESSLGT